MSWWRRSRPPPAGEPATSSSDEVGGQVVQHKAQVGLLVKLCNTRSGGVCGQVVRYKVKEGHA